MRTTAIRRLVLTAALAAAVALSAGASSANAGPKPRVDVRGMGTYATTDAGAAVITGTATGFPVEGPYGATLTADDGSLPPPGECEAATGTVRIEDAKGAVLAFNGAGNVCGKWTDAVMVVTHVFTGRYTVTEAPKRPVLRSDGFFELRLANNGVASMFAIDT